ncbi:HEAT repeat domain-containing protein [bacterium]|nr:HEAT repeat domain-containing protein [bacterium]
MGIFTVAVIDDMILEALVSDDIEARKQAVRDLARTRSREALNLLAELQRDDDDPEVRELARKGWTYVRKHLPEDKLDAKVRKTKGATAYAIHDLIRMTLISR